ncbi:MAG: hypothetical protein K6D38_09660 [Pseudobutyrivibrio sp.]|nr:hypothetical protein [Pseudobutyrivibrio sp.]
MKVNTKIIFAAAIVMTLFMGCGEKEVVEEGLMEPPEETSAVVEDNEVELADADNSTTAENNNSMTVEQFFTEHPDDLKEVIEVNSTEEFVLNIVPKDNTMYISYTIPEGKTDEEIEDYKARIGEYISNKDTKSVVDGAKKNLGEHVGVNSEDIVYDFTYFDPVGNQIAHTVF